MSAQSELVAVDVQAIQPRRSRKADQAGQQRVGDIHECGQAQ